MNSHEILKQLNRLVNDREVPIRARNIIHQAISHIKKQGEEMDDMQDDITDLKLNPEKQS